MVTIKKSVERRGKCRGAISRLLGKVIQDGPVIPQRLLHRRPCGFQHEGLHLLAQALHLRVRRTSRNTHTRPSSDVPTRVKSPQHRAGCGLSIIKPRTRLRRRSPSELRDDLQEARRRRLCDCVDERLREKNHSFKKHSTRKVDASSLSPLPPREHRTEAAAAGAAKQSWLGRLPARLLVSAEERGLHRFFREGVVEQRDERIRQLLPALRSRV